MSEYVYATDEHKGHWLTGEPIVRCRDCVFYESVAEDSGDWCGYWTDRVYVNVRGDGFCAWGERRGDAE